MECATRAILSKCCSPVANSRNKLEEMGEGRRARKLSESSNDYGFSGLSQISEGPCIHLLRPPMQLKTRKTCVARETKSSHAHHRKLNSRQGDMNAETTNPASLGGTFSSEDYRS